MIYKMEKFIDNLFVFSFFLVFGSGLGVTIGLIVSMSQVDEKVQKLQYDAAFYKMKSEEGCSCVEGKTP